VISPSPPTPPPPPKRIAHLRCARALERAHAVHKLSICFQVGIWGVSLLKECCSFSSLVFVEWPPRFFFFFFLFLPSSSGCLLIFLAWSMSLRSPGHSGGAMGDESKIPGFVGYNPASRTWTRASFSFYLSGLLLTPYTQVVKLTRRRQRSFRVLQTRHGGVWHFFCRPFMRHLLLDPLKIRLSFILIFRFFQGDILYPAPCTASIRAIPILPHITRILSLLSLLGSSPRD